MAKFFLSIYRFFNKSRIIFFVTMISVFAICVFFAMRIKFEEDISKILPSDKNISKLNEVFQNSKFVDKLTFTISMQDTTAVSPDSLVQFADTLVSALQQNVNKYIRKINYRIDDSLIIN